MSFIYHSHHRGGQIYDALDRAFHEHEERMVGSKVEINREIKEILVGYEHKLVKKYVAQSA